MRVSHWLGFLLLAQAVPATAQIAVSGNDGKQRPADPATSEDTVSILDISPAGVRQLATIPTPASLTGPPASVAVAPDSGFAIVTAAQRRGADGKNAPADIVTVIDLADPQHPAVLQTLHAGAGASGVAISPDATLALVANGGADNVSVFRIAGKTLTPAGTVALAAKSTPLSITFSGDGRSAYVVTQGDGRLVRLAVDSQGGVTPTSDAVTLGLKPYGMSINRATGIAYIANLEGRREAPAGGVGTVAIVDLAANRMVGQIDVGATPEQVSLSPSGRYLEVNLINGSTKPTSAPDYHDHGLLRVFGIEGTTLTPIAEARTGKWCQGAVWSEDEQRILLQCAADQQIEVYRFDGRTLAALPGETVQLDARPGAMATAISR